MRDPLHPRPDVHDFHACLARSAEGVARARQLGERLFAEDEDTSDAAQEALARATRALDEARATVRAAAVRFALRRGLGDVAALEVADLTRMLELADVPSLSVYVDRQATLHVGEGGLRTWTLTRDTSPAALAAMVAEMKEHLPDFLRDV